jgi:hypothetical protein
MIPFLYSIADLRAKTDSYQKIRSLITVCNYLANFLISLVEIGRPPTHVLPASFYYHWSMFPHHHVIEVEDDDDDMELQSEGEGNGTYSATGMAISELGMGAKYIVTKDSTCMNLF